jgi:Fe-S cluster assembly ATP-binding protein
MLKIKNLSVFAEDKKIISDINMELEKGKIYILQGPNGSGKSTLANAIIGNTKYEVSGEMLFENESILNLSPTKISKKGIFLSFQNPPKISGVNIFNFLRTSYNSLNEIKISLLDFKRLVDVKIKELNLDENFLDRNLNENFSGGEKKKLEILQLLVLNPKIAILDEIDSGLDESSREIFLSSAKKLKSEGKTLLVITHYKDFANRINPDKIFSIEDGKLKRN